MIKRRPTTILALLFLLLVVFAGQSVQAQETVHLFPDRSFAVSGDTVWFFVVVHSENPEKSSGVVHVQLDNLANNHITQVSVKCDGNTGKGYIYIPDSLSTGTYLLRPFSLLQKNSGREDVHQKLLTVYNRFDKGISWIETPENINFKKYTANKQIRISTNKKQYNKREQVKVSIEIPAESTAAYKNVFITTGLADPLSDDYLTGEIPSGKITAATSPVNLVEQNGVLITGTVYSAATGQSVPNATVLLSIPDTIPFFDYYISDSAGVFYFYLRNATGDADLVFQALPAENREYKIDLLGNFIEAGALESGRKFISPEESGFADNVIEASYYQKLFAGYRGNSADKFTMPMQFDYPFYGQPTNTFDPDLFFDLPDFQEISREIINGVQYRERKNDTTIRLVDYGNRALFKQEPLKLLDGIPIFDNSIITPLGTEDIQKVDVVNYKRYFGDLTFNGVLSIYSKQLSYNWVDLHPRLSHFKYSCLQPFKTFNFRNQREKTATIPNLNKIIYRSVIKELKPNMDFDFYASDIKGTVKINVILIDKDNRISFAQNFIEIK